MFGIGVGGWFGIGEGLRVGVYDWVGVGMEVEDIITPLPKDCLFRAVFRFSLLPPPKIVLLFRKFFYKLNKIVIFILIKIFFKINGIIIF